MFPKAAIGFPDPANPLLTVISGAWLIGLMGPDDWTVAGATCFMLIPIYFASIWIEGAVARNKILEVERDQASRWAWRGNMWSYALLEIAAVGWLIGTVLRSG